MIDEVLAKRADAASAGKIVEFARSTRQKEAAIAAFKSVNFTAGDEQFSTLLAMMEFAKDDEIKAAAENVAKEVYRRSPDRSKLTSEVNMKLTAANAPNSTVNPKFREVLLRLQAASGGR